MFGSTMSDDTFYPITGFFQRGSYVVLQQKGDASCFSLEPKKKVSLFKSLASINSISVHSPIPSLPGH